MILFKRLPLFIFKLLVLITPMSLLAAAREEYLDLECAISLAKTPSDRKNSLDEIRSAKKESFNKVTSAWQLMSTDVPRLKNVAAFGSGATDIIELISLAPDADHYYLYDLLDFGYSHTLTEYYDGKIESLGTSGNIILYLAALLKDLSYDKTVSILDQGFLKSVSREVLKIHFGNWFSVSLRTRPELRKPIVFKIKRMTTAGTISERLVSFYPLDQDDPEQVQVAMQNFGKENPLDLALWERGTTITSHPQTLRKIGEALIQSNGYLVLNRQFGITESDVSTFKKNALDLKEHLELLDFYSMGIITTIEAHTIFRSINTKPTPIREILASAGLKPVDVKSMIREVEGKSPELTLVMKLENPEN